MTNRGFRMGSPHSAYIGEGVTVKGAIFVPDEIVVDGVVEGDVTAQSIRIGASGAIKGNVVSIDLEVSGTLEQSAEVKEVVVIRSSGRVEGNVNCGDFEVEKGAVLRGGLFSVYAKADAGPGRHDRTVPRRSVAGFSEAKVLKLNAAE